MKRRIYHWYNALLAALLSMLGLGSCENGPFGNMTCEYGCPNIDFHVRGTVTDGEGRPVEGIKVKLEEQSKFEDQVIHYGIDSVATNERGEYQTRTLNVVGIDDNLKLIVEDTDGAANGGEFLSDTISLSQMPRKMVKKGDKNWYQGGFELTANVTLKK